MIELYVSEIPGYDPAQGRLLEGATVIEPVYIWMEDPDLLVTPPVDFYLDGVFVNTENSHAWEFGGPNVFEPGSHIITANWNGESRSSTFTAVAEGTDGVNLAWTDNATNEDGFKVYKKPLGSSTFSLIDTINNPNVQSYTDPTGGSGDTYRVSAFNAAGESGFSNEFTIPAPPSSGLPNEPAGFTTLVDFDYSTDPGVETVGDWNWQLLSDAPGAPRTPPDYMQVKLQDGYVAGTGGSPGLHSWNFAEQKELYVAAWYRLPSTAGGWEQEHTGTKMLYILHGYTGSGAASTLFWTNPSTPGAQGIFTDLPVAISAAYFENDVKTRVGLDYGGWYGSGKTPKFSVGDWHLVETYYKLNDPETSFNGVFKMWVDGNSIVNVTNTRYVSPSNNTGFFNVKHAWIWGGTDGVKTRDDFIDVDHIYVSGLAIDTPPPSSGHPNEPSGLVELTERSFTILEEDGWGRNQDYPIVDQSDAPRSPTKVGRASYYAGHEGGSSPLQTWKHYGDQREIYVHFWVKLSDNWWGHPSQVNKIGYIGTQNQPGSPGIFAWHYQAEGPYRFEFKLQGQDYGITGGARNLAANVDYAASFVNRGDWAEVEFYWKMNSSNTPDGICKAWVNGVLTHSYSDVIWLTANQWQYFTEVQWRPVWGGVGAVVGDGAGGGPATGLPFHMYLDHIYISGKSVSVPAPGPNPGPGATILMDTRAGGAEDIQVATSIADAKARMGAAFIRTGIQWAMDYDGAGTRAFRHPWYGTDADDFGDRTLAIEKQYPLHDEIWIQWKMRMGRHANDAGSSHGNVDEFDCTNELEAGWPGGSQNSGRKLFTFVRESDESFGRMTMIVRGPQGWTNVHSSESGLFESPWDFGDFNRFVASVVTVTVQMVKESATDAGDGIVRVWYNDVLEIDGTNLNTAPLQFGHRIKYNSVFRSPKMNMVEYWYDFVTWTPSSGPNPNPDPDLDLDFEDYADTAALRADSENNFWVGPSNETFVDLVSDAASGLGLSKSMQYTYPATVGWDPGGPNEDGKDFTILTDVLLTDHGINESGLKTIWTECYLRWSPNFTTIGPATGNPDHKTFLIGVDAGGTGRVEWKAGTTNNENIRVGFSGTPIYDVGSAKTLLWDGAWHRVRCYADWTTPATSHFKLWVDDTLVGDETGNGTAATSTWTNFKFLRLGANLNKGSYQSMWLRWNRIRVWTSNPGW